MKLKPIKTTKNLTFYTLGSEKLDNISLFEGSVPAGFPSPTDDVMDLDLNLHDYLVRNPTETFCVKAVGESMKDAGIQSGDVMLVDRAIEPRNRSIVLAVIDNEFTVKRVNVSDKKLYLMPENENFTPIEITEDMDFKVWGVVTYVIHKV
ncbi:MAG: translesion error-prone DNA polymerase V autoproteolytic subunit [Flavobacteriales bacterium]|jgi:DNA polymerase V|nr:translesion error-prone DNA polymerase V autoproteolytic subunit [Flavobacteriales bacterium]MBT5090551.1 translesion error-prone DNA polymerase V autoproteolytic subunit [Flavobacteriales bacterium]MBT5750127.1 translesion error-prone DNA polymerase V autoproteolytic subunit [Flavobacteriales bacterium]MBT6325603.1 translesion error-prone DNA polymerase V autoproteolytic subunit [Bdellovibrionales bacterium]